MPLLFLFSPGDSINISEQAKIKSIAKIETVGIKDKDIADPEETGDQSGISIHAPLLFESGENGSPGAELSGKHFPSPPSISSHFSMLILDF